MFFVACGYDSVVGTIAPFNRGAQLLLKTPVFGLRWVFLPNAFVKTDGEWLLLELIIKSKGKWRHGGSAESI